ncbi:hypothetical protein [Streptomyces meridianus]|uniref:Uncharacterized protein n=1 Tax=Streptomyces meridianus TaxID=2938945 RepID=A0ABT0XCP2_9ACTN|nr:hypothetical protein [Streptomyces meridianus]MCM2580281.1 hypothetical protein [Streptomyces meridianus]
MENDEGRHGWSTAAFFCPACKRPVQTVAAGRRKVLGAFVPAWGPGPCENPECPEHRGTLHPAGGDGTRKHGERRPG